jgi:hypothetical protein
MDPITILLGIGSKLIDKLFPDPAQKAAAQLELFKLQQNGELAQLTADTQLAQDQLDINKAEASNSSLFVSGGRPFILWICGIGFAVQFVFGPLAQWVSSLAGHAVVFPTLDWSVMMPMLMGMLGLGGFRTIEKIKGVAA